MEMISTEELMTRSDLPWIIFRLKDNLYAVNSKYVNGIQMNTEKLTPMPEAPDYYRGLQERRGEVFPILDLRRVFELDTVNDELTAFHSMMEQYKNAHVNWVNTLEDCVRSGKKFTLATDPHKCDFGKWYYSYISENNSSSFYIKKAEKPHSLLHGIAKKAIAASAGGMNSETEELIKTARENYMPKVLAALDDAEKEYKETLREMLIVLSDNGKLLGLTVDAVIDIGILAPVNDGEKVNMLSHSKYLTTVARTGKMNKDIFVVNEAEIMKFANVH